MPDATYSVARRALFRLPPETAHWLVLSALSVRAKLSPPPPPPRASPRRVMGLNFANPLGLAAGFDKNARYVDALAALGFGFIEVGGITPKPQPGNPRPRIFRLPAHGALVNRMGLNNCGANIAAENLARRKWRGIIGVNIGKNADTPMSRAAEDYVYCLRALYSFGDFFTLNLSSPNTPHLQDLQHGAAFAQLLRAVSAERDQLADAYGRRAPLAIKISPDMDEEELSTFAAAIGDEKTGAKIDAVIACNTTIHRPPGVAQTLAGGEPGGLSGKPLAARSSEIIRQLRASLPPATAIIGVGGIFSPADAAEKLAAGADLLQLYTGLIYEGPGLPGRIVDALSDSKPPPRGGYNPPE